jgi:putative ubiquitin-RnfH superfamily antitoxin RatB of RatAB toxin-antitoxin module
MKVGVAYADGARQLWLRIEVPEGATVGEAIGRAGLLERCPEIDLARQKVGVFGRIVALDTPLAPGDRVEVYRAIVCDPSQVPRRGGADDD